jgi:hypothetical protein
MTTQQQIKQNLGDPSWAGARDLDVRLRPNDGEAIRIEPFIVHASIGEPIEGGVAAMELWAEGVDTCAHLTDQQIEHAVVREPLLSYAVRLLTQQHGKPVARADLERRLQANPRLEALRQLADAVQGELAVRKGLQAVAAVEAERARAEEAREPRHQRNHGPRCGARTRTGRPCMRKVVLGKRRCPNHGGLSTGPKTPGGKAQSLAALRRGRKRARQAR